MGILRDLRWLSTASTSITCYHRTHKINSIRGIVVGGAVFGKGAMYGAGFYMTRDIKSQMNDRMARVYGPYIVKCQVDISNYLNFDRYEFPVAPIEQQLQKHDIDLNRRSILTQPFMGPPQNETFTSDYVLNVLSRDLYSEIHSNFAGVIYTGRKDGKCCVAYDFSTVTPINYTLDGTTWKAFKFKTVKENTDLHSISPTLLLLTLRKALAQRNAEMLHRIASATTPKTFLNRLGFKWKNLEKLLTFIRMLGPLHEPINSILQQAVIRCIVEQLVYLKSKGLDYRLLDDLQYHFYNLRTLLTISKEDMQNLFKQEAMRQRLPKNMRADLNSVLKD